MLQILLHDKDDFVILNLFYFQPLTCNKEYHFSRSFKHFLLMLLVSMISILAKIWLNLLEKSKSYSTQNILYTVNNR